MPLYSYECPTGHSYDEVLTMADYQKPTKCPKCKKRGKKVIALRQAEPNFTDKLYPFWDTGLHKVFHSDQERRGYMKANGWVQGNYGTMGKKQERQLMDLRVGRFDKKKAQYAY